MKSRHSLSLMLARLLSLLVTFISVPLLRRWLGSDLYGVYALGLNFYPFVSLLDVGFSIGAQKRMTEAFHAGRADEAWRIQRVQLGLGLLVAVGGIALYALLGLVYPFRHLPAGQTLPFLALMGVQFAASWLGLYVSGALAARDKFALVGLINFLLVIGGALGALWATYAFRTLVALAAGYGCGAAAGLLLAIALLKALDPDLRLRPRFERETAREIAQDGLPNYPNRVVGTFSNRSDRQIIGAYRERMAGDYQIVCRPIEILYELLGSTVDTLQPEVTRGLSEGPAEAAQTLHRNSLIVWAVACSFLVVPAAFGGPVIRLWLGEPLFGLEGAVMLGVALSYACELHYRALGTVYVARGTLYRTAWFPLANALFTVALTYPVVSRYGLFGVAAMNGALSLVQIYPRIANVRREVDGAYPVGRHFLASLAILLLASLFALGGYALAESSVSPWISVAAAPVVCLACLAACVLSGLSPAPRFLHRYGLK